MLNLHERKMIYILKTLVDIITGSCNDTCHDAWENFIIFIYLFYFILFVYFLFVFMVVGL